MGVRTATAGMPCPDCKGTGRNGSLCGYALVCRLCAGLGYRILTFAHN